MFLLINSCFNFLYILHQFNLAVLEKSASHPVRPLSKYSLSKNKYLCPILVEVITSYNQILAGPTEKLLSRYELQSTWNISNDVTYWHLLLKSAYLWKKINVWMELHSPIWAVLEIKLPLPGFLSIVVLSDQSDWLCNQEYK